MTPELNKDGKQTPPGDLPDNNNQPVDKTFTVNGQEMTGEKLLESYNNLQSEFTKKSQALSEKDNNPLDQELEQTKEVLKKMGFATTEELEEFKSFKESVETDRQKANYEKEFNDFVSDFKTLTEPQKAILKDLKKLHKDKDYSEILKTTGFIDQAQIEKSKGNTKVLGSNIGIPPVKEEEKNIMDRPNVKKFGILSPEEYKKKMESVGL